MQLPLPTTELPQLFVWVKFVFEIAIVKIATAADPLLVKVKATGFPLLPAYTEVKVLVAGLNVAAPVLGFAPDPLNASVVPLPELTFTFTEPL